MTIGRLEQLIFLGHCKQQGQGFCFGFGFGFGFGFCFGFCFGFGFGFGFGFCFGLPFSRLREKVPNGRMRGAFDFA